MLISAGCALVSPLCQPCPRVTQEPRLSGEHLLALAKAVRDLQVLRAGTLALPAADTVRRPVTLRDLHILLPGLRCLSVAEVQIGGGKNLGDRNLFRTSTGAIVAASAGELRRMAEKLLRLPDDLLLLRIQRPKVLHKGNCFVPPFRKMFYYGIFSYF